MLDLMGRVSEMKWVGVTAGVTGVIGGVTAGVTAGANPIKQCKHLAGVK